ncbi:cyclin-dependent kinase 2-interacting protein-like [Corticium candelabrum]|uniref:cyclin-dependent kinase 2-interacting protein-like n=1 Tax=Corticium candelabrum TaxID=121492 RepID=UPI002E273E06|nr:cyclin-dependent kinase 2-interacting protein-like [Corticium candelabrum]
MEDEQRRISDCCASLHEHIQKWKKLNASGVRVANDLINLKLQTDYVDGAESWGSLSNVKDLPGRVIAKLQDDVEKKYEELKIIFEALREVHQKMGSLSRNVRAVSQLMWISNGEEASSKPLFHTMTACQFSKRFEQLYDIYTHELAVKETIIGAIPDEQNRDTLTLYISTWLHEPYIDESSIILLESMLIETGLKKT